MMHIQRVCSQKCCWRPCFVSSAI